MKRMALESGCRALSMSAIGGIALVTGLAAGCLDGGAEVEVVAAGDPRHPGVTKDNAPRPSFGETTTQADPPPPLSGGTLAISVDGIAVAADPDRDRVYLAKLADGSVTRVQLAPHDEPGRVALDDDGRAHVALRRGGAVATIELSTGAILARRDVCPAPRGITFDRARTRMLVACETGEVVSFAPEPGAEPRTVAHVADDLRDVVVVGDSIAVSRFRTAEVVRMAADGSGPEVLPGAGGTLSAVTFGWRMLAPLPNGERPVMIAQAPILGPISVSPGGYGSNASTVTSDGCRPIGPVLPVLDTGIGPVRSLPAQATLPLDVARLTKGFAFIAAGNAHTPELPQVYVVDDDETGCEPSERWHANGEITSLATFRDAIVVQSREPAQLEFVREGRVLRLDDDSRADTGHVVFHSNSGLGVACASCHGEGGDDAHTWTFSEIGDRRTPSLRGTLNGTAPYHWNGEMSDIAQLANDVMTGRMSGPELDQGQTDALQRWLFALPAPATVKNVDDGAIARGKELFEKPTVGCATCHSGPLFTNSANVDVGTGGVFQVPSLVGIRFHAPYLHNGCATTLEQRFTWHCGGSSHGNVDTLSEGDVGDLVAYLKTL